jgi:ubiquitin-conjugating enzyme E2 J2
MLEKSPTLGSIETTEAVKRRMASSSHEFNLKDNVFLELFPEMAKKSRQIVNKSNNVNNYNRTSADGSGKNVGLNDSLDPEEASRRQLEHNEIIGRGFYGAVTNFLVIGGFAAFAFVVQYVIQSLGTAD